MFSDQAKGEEIVLLSEMNFSLISSTTWSRSHRQLTYLLPSAPVDVVLKQVVKLLAVHTIGLQVLWLS
jgi:hypothetical protein